MITMSECKDGKTGRFDLWSINKDWIKNYIVDQNICAKVEKLTKVCDLKKEIKIKQKFNFKGSIFEFYQSPVPIRKQLNTENNNNKQINSILFCGGIYDYDNQNVFITKAKICEIKNSFPIDIAVRTNLLAKDKKPKTEITTEVIDKEKFYLDLGIIHNAKSNTSEKKSTLWLSPYHEHSPYLFSTFGTIKIEQILQGLTYLPTYPSKDIKKYVNENNIIEDDSIQKWVLVPKKHFIYQMVLKDMDNINKNKNIGDAETFDVDLKKNNTIFKAEFVKVDQIYINILLYRFKDQIISNNSLELINLNEIYFELCSTKSFTTILNQNQKHHIKKFKNIVSNNKQWMQLDPECVDKYIKSKKSKKINNDDNEQMDMDMDMDIDDNNDDDDNDINLFLDESLYKEQIRKFLQTERNFDYTIKLDVICFPKKMSENDGIIVS